MFFITFNLFSLYNILFSLDFTLESFIVKYILLNIVFDGH